MIIYLVPILLSESNELTFHGSTSLRRINQYNLFILACAAQQSGAALLFLQAGLGTPRCRHRGSMVAFDSRAKTSIHFSRFSRLSRDSIVSVPLSRPDSSRIGRWALPTATTSINLIKSKRVRTFLADVTSARSSVMNKTLQIYHRFVWLSSFFVVCLFV